MRIKDIFTMGNIDKCMCKTRLKGSGSPEGNRMRCLKPCLQNDTDIYAREGEGISMKDE